MDDIEITRKCAEAMGYRVGNLASKIVAFDVSPHAIIASNDSGGDSVYDPLNNDAQAMALMKKFLIDVFALSSGWRAHKSAFQNAVNVDNANLNRAICECVARLAI